MCSKLGIHVLQIHFNSLNLLSETNLSMNSIGAEASNISPNMSLPQNLPRSPEEVHPTLTLSEREFSYKDGGAHWYRSSAILLRYHKYVDTTVHADIIFCAAINTGLKLARQLDVVHICK